MKVFCKGCIGNWITSKLAIVRSKRRNEKARVLFGVQRLEPRFLLEAI